MREGRYLAMCVVFFIAGDFLGAFLTIAPEIYLGLALLFACGSIHFRDNLCFAITFILLGAASVQIGRIPALAQESYLKMVSFELKSQFSLFLERIIPSPEERSIVKALTIGDKSDISRSILNDYKSSGAIHLLALSGLHVGVIYKLLTIALKPFGGHIVMKVIKSVIVILSMWSFAILTGLSSSISRAVIMITFYELSDYTQSDRDGLTVLSASALFIVLLNPEAPREIGFQLSFLAMISIYTIFPLLKRVLVTRIKILKYVWDILALSISCQMTTGVVSYLYFGTFPRFFMITNLISMPLITIIMYLIVSSLVFVNVPWIGELLVSVLQKTIHLMNEIMSIISGL